MLDIDDVISVEYSNREGLRNALSTIILLLQNEEMGFCLQKQSLEDYPECGIRSVLIDLARGLPDYERLKEDVKRLALAKCNYIHLHLMDSFGICYESDVLGMPSDGIRGTKIYTKAQMKEFVSYCDALGIELIPEFEIPAHANYIVEKFPQMACQVDIENPSKAVVCVGSEQTYAFFERLIAEICEIFPSKYIHMGGDELYFDDLPDWNWKPHWMDCKVCQQKMKEEGITDIQGLYYYVVNRVHKILSSYGKTMIMYNDEIDISKPVPISKDIIMQFWRIAYKYRGPSVGCSYQKFLEQGFKVIVSPYEYTYIDMEEYANPERSSWFDFKNYKNSRALSAGVLGGETCAWEYGNPEYTHYNFSFTSAAILLLAKMWDNSHVVYDTNYRKCLTRLILGYEAPNGYDIFQLFGSIMPPRINNVVSYVGEGNALLEEEEIIKHQEVLSGINHTYSPVYVSNLLAHIKNIYPKE